MRASKSLPSSLPTCSPLTRNYSNLTCVEDKLAGWSKYNYPTSLSEFRSLHSPPLLIGPQVRRGRIKSGISGFVKELASVVSWVKVVLVTFAVGSQIVVVSENPSVPGYTGHPRPIAWERGSDRDRL